jgi:hypothetical protein
MNLIHAKSIEKGWDLKLGELARTWKGGCIIRAVFLDRIKKAYDKNPDLASLLIDPEFAKEMVERQSTWRRVVTLAINGTMKLKFSFLESQWQSSDSFRCINVDLLAQPKPKEVDFNSMSDVQKESFIRESRSTCAVFETLGPAFFKRVWRGRFS